MRGEGDGFFLSRAGFEGRQRIAGARAVRGRRQRTPLPRPSAPLNDLLDRLVADATDYQVPEGLDRYGRLGAHVYLDGEHVGWLLSRDGLARPLEAGVQMDWCG